MLHIFQNELMLRVNRLSDFKITKFTKKIYLFHQMPNKRYIFKYIYAYMNYKLSKNYINYKLSKLSKN